MQFDEIFQMGGEKPPTTCSLYTLPKTNTAPEKMVSQKERIVFQLSIFSENVCFTGCRLLFS